MGGPPSARRGRGAAGAPLKLPVESKEAAETEGRELYAQARAVAGLAPAEAQVLGLLSPIFAAAPHDRLLVEVEVLIDTRRYDWAVVRAQTACEVFATLALDRIARGRVDDDRAPSTLFRSVSLGDRKDRIMFHELTGVEIAAQAWWPSYDLHRNRRNEIVHAGQP